LLDTSLDGSDHDDTATAEAVGLRPLSPSRRRSNNSRGSLVHPVLDLHVGSDDDVSIASGDILDEVDSGILSSIASLLGGKRYLVLLLLFLASVAKKGNGGHGHGHGGLGGGSGLSRRRADAASTSGGLGSAMIGSLTTALSPILPFAGGVDLRRVEHWGLDEDTINRPGWSSWFWSSSSHAAPSLLSAQSPLSSDVASSVPRGGAKADTATSSPTDKSKLKVKISRTAVSREPILAASEPFVPTEEIAQLTLTDIAVVFRYSVESSTDGFDASGFQESASGENGPLSERMVYVLTAIDDAVAKSRGRGVVEATTKPRQGDADLDSSPTPSPLSSLAGYGDVDALKFCAAMRLLAEWRVLRQVPEGYRGYAVGMGLGHKDVVQNIVKIEAAVHDLIELRKQEHEHALESMEQDWDKASCQADGYGDEPTCESAANSENNEEGKRTSTPPIPTSPTLRELLQYEIDEEIQNVGKLPRLKEKSAGMGLLWVRRQLHYQTEIFSNVMLVPDVYQSATDAVAAAYTSVYDRYHGWAVQKIFNYSFQAAPDVDVIYRHMNPTKLQEVTAAAMNGDAEGLFDGSGDDVDSTPFPKEKMEESESFLVYDDELNQTPFYNLHMANETQYVEAWSIPDESIEGKEGTNPWIRFGLHIASEWDKLSAHVEAELDKFGKHMEGEWDKAVSGIIGLFQGNDASNDQGLPFSTDVRGGGTLSGEALDRYLSVKMEEDAKMHIARYLEVVSPLLEDIRGLFEEMNCDDPTKV